MFRIKLPRQFSRITRERHEEALRYKISANASASRCFSAFLHSVAQCNTRNGRGTYYSSVEFIVAAGNRQLPLILSALREHRSRRFANRPRNNSSRTVMLFFIAYHCIFAVNTCATAAIFLPEIEKSALRETISAPAFLPHFFFDSIGSVEPDFSLSVFLIYSGKHNRSLNAGAESARPRRPYCADQKSHSYPTDPRIITSTGTTANSHSHTYARARARAWGVPYTQPTRMNA